MDPSHIENMQNTIKSLQQRSLHIEKLLEKGSDVIIFQIGSDTIKYGLANQKFPNKIKTLLAYKIKKDLKDLDKEEQEKIKSQTFHQPHEIVQDYEEFDAACTQVETTLRKRGAIKPEPKSYKGKPKAKLEQDLKREFISNVKDNSQDPDYVFEDDVYFYEQRPDYAVKKPISHGFFNLNEGKETIESVTSDIQRLIDYVLVEKMNIKRSQFGQHNIILVIPDIFQRQQIKSLVSMFLVSFGFNAIYLHLESVLATFGACMNQACVVDVGFQKISVCCVDEGLILNNTMVRKNFGGDDIDNIFYRLLTKKHSALFKKKGSKLEPTLYGDMQSLSRVKEKVCSFLQQEDNSNRIYEVNVFREKEQEIYNIFHNETVYIAPQSLYNSALFKAMNKFKSEESKKFYDFTERYFDLYVDPEDFLEEYSGGGVYNKNQIYSTNNFQTHQQLEQQQQQQQQEKQQQEQNEQQTKGISKENQQENTQTKKGGKLVIKKEEDSKMDIEDYQNEQKNFEKKRLPIQDMLDPCTMVNLDLMIAFSIGQCRDIEQKRKMANNILIIGGTVQFAKFIEELEDRLIENISSYCPIVDRVEVIDCLVTREILPAYLSWYGATVIPRIDSINDLWITRNRWIATTLEEELTNDASKREKSNEFGIRYLKEKVPFQW